MTHYWPIPFIEEKTFSSIEERRKVALVTTAAAWAAVESRLNLSIVWQAEMNEATVPAWRKLLDTIEGEVIYAVGGGLAVDAAKYLAAEKDLPLVCLPTALSVDAFLTWASGYREGDCVRYVETRCPDRLIIDYDVLASAPESIRAAGICDTLSIATGRWDWKYAEEKGMNTEATRFIPYIDRMAEAILNGSLDCAASAGRGERDGLKQLLDGLAMEVQMCNLIGHSRPEEGSEHYFAYSVENTMGKGLPHGDLVGPGILLMAEFQGQETAPLRKALEDCQIQLNSIPNPVIRETLLNLPDYCRKQGLPHGIAHDLTQDQIDRLVP
ncbi:MAG: iron-containing alcohol dehydrogenase [Candidatus Omnitrophica bacterium]|nr:iron-containing alcohol dehydrogenase [Candidatus Omnitrophota bacterium]